MIETMKKFFILICLLLSVSAVSVSAQNEWNPAPFKHLSLGVGVSTAGADIELATTLGHHFQLRAGVSALPYTFSMPYDMGLRDVLSEVDERVLRGAGVDLEEIPNEVDIEATLGLINGKVLLDIYPFKKAGIHLTAGAYLGNDKFFSVGAQMPRKFMQAWDDIRNYDPNVEFNDEFMDMLPKDGEIELTMEVKKVKPYLGMGLSRAVPKRRISFNVDCGVMFHGTPEIETNVDELDDMLKDEGVFDIMEKVVVYPVISFRLVGRIF